MKQEDKELLLKDLCARLPYGVKVHAKYIDIDTNTEVEKVGVLNIVDNDKVIAYVKEMIKEAELEIKEEAFINYTREDAQIHYAEHFRGSYENAKGFYMELEDYITSDKVYGMVVEGEEAISKLRSVIKVVRIAVPKMLNEEPRLTENVMHGSDCKESADNEIAIFRRLAKLNKKR